MRVYGRNKTTGIHIIYVSLWYPYKVRVQNGISARPHLSRMPSYVISVLCHLCSKIFSDCDGHVYGLYQEVWATGRVQLFGAVSRDGL